MLCTSAPREGARLRTWAMWATLCGALTTPALIGAHSSASVVDQQMAPRVRQGRGPAFSSGRQDAPTPGLWKRYREEAVAALVLFTVQTGLIVGLLVQRRRRRAAEVKARRLAGMMLTAQEDERTRIARDLHDGVCQQLASVAVDLSCLRQRCTGADRAMAHALGALQQRASGIAEDLRRLSHSLHPSVLQHIGLVEALRGHCAEVERQHGLHIGVHVDGDVEPASPRAALALFRIAQEALRNSVRHSQAAHATVSLVRSRHHLTLTLSDDGRGFDPATTRASGCLGLVSIEERTRLMDGHVVVRSSPNRGVTIEARVPVDLPGPLSGVEHGDARGLASADAIT